MGVAACGGVGDGEGGVALLGGGESVYRVYGVGAAVAGGGACDGELGGGYAGGVGAGDRPFGVLGHIVQSVYGAGEVSAYCQACGGGEGDVGILGEDQDDLDAASVAAGGSERQVNGAGGGAGCQIRESGDGDSAAALGGDGHAGRSGGDVAAGEGVGAVRGVGEEVYRGRSAAGDLVLPSVKCDERPGADGQRDYAV